MDKVEGGDYLEHLLSVVKAELYYGDTGHSNGNYLVYWDGRDGITMAVRKMIDD